MLELYKYEGKTKEEALNKALTELSLNEDELFINEEEIEGKLFKAKKYQINVLKKEDVKLEIKKFIKDLSEKINLEINLEIKEEEGIYNVLLVSDNNAILIGKDGRTLNSIQLLLRQHLNRNGVFNIKVNLDVSGYKAKKVKNTEYEIKRIATTIVRTKVEAKLDPMNSYERRIVHTVISNYPMLETESVGEEPERYVIIRYKEEK